MSKSPVYIGAGSNELGVQAALNLIQDGIDSATHLVTIADWVHLTDGTTVVDRTTGVDSLKYSAKEYAQGDNASTGGSAKDYATYVGGGVRGETGDHSAKAWAVGGTGVTSVTGSAKQWALGGGASATEATEVTSGLYSARRYASLASADLVLTNADVVSAEADKVQTGLDRVATAADKVATNADVVLTNADVILAEADKVQTGLDRVATAADKVATNADVVLTTADELLTRADTVLTAADVVLTHADVVLTNADVVLAEADKVQTGLDRTAVAADLVATNQDTIDTAADLVATNQDTIDTAADLVLTNADVVLTHADEVLTRADTVLTAADVVSTNADVVTASASEVAARASAAAVAQTYDNFTDVYLGSMRTDKTVADAVTLTGASWAKDSSSIAFTGTSSGTVTIGQELTTINGLAPDPVGANIIGSQITTPIVISNPFPTAATSATLVFVGSGVNGAFNSGTGGPAANNDGDALVSGNLYFNPQSNEMRIWTGAAWIAATAVGQTSLLEYKYVTNANQIDSGHAAYKTYSGVDAGGSASLSYTQDNILVFMNGVQLKDTTDYAATNGSSVVLVVAPVLNDEIAVIAFKSFTTADMVSKSSGGTFAGAVTFGAGLVANTADINGGTFDGIVGGTTPAAGSFTTIGASGAITGALTGNASTATALATARAINGVDFDGSAPITVTAAADTLTATTLNSAVVSSSLTSVGTLTALTGGTGDFNWDSNTLTVDSSASNVGIGTATPRSVDKMNIYKASQDPTNYASDNSLPAHLGLFSTDSYAADKGATLALGGNLTPGFDMPFAFISGRKENATNDNRDGYFTIHTSKQASPYATEVMRITSAGNVGIGSNAPSSLLHVYNNTAATASEIKIENATAGQNAALMIKTTVGDWDVGSNINAAAGSFEVYERTSGSAGSRFTIAPGGNVGIGTTAPGYMFTVAENRAGNWAASIVNDASDGAGLMVEAGDQSNCKAFKVTGGSTEVLTVKGDGNVGINDTTPVSKLEISADDVTWDGTWADVRNSAGTAGSQFNDTCVLHLNTKRNSSSGGIVGMAFSPGYTNHQNWGIYATATGGGGSNHGDLHFVDVDNTGAAYPRMTLKTGGNISRDNYTSHKVMAAGHNVTLDTGISVNGSTAGKTLLVIHSGHTSSGTATTSQLILVRCGYDGNNTPVKYDIDGNHSSITVAKSASNTVTLDAGGSSSHYYITEIS